MKVLRAGNIVILAILFSCVARGQETSSQGGTRIQKGPLMTIPGCGNSGCNAYYNVCVDVPPGATPIAITNYYDSFIGWGGFGQTRKTPTGFCAVYWQHSHNVTRNVSFDVIYEPPKAASSVPTSTETLQISPSEPEIVKKAETGEVFSGPKGSPARAINGQFLQTLIYMLKDDPKVKVRGLEIDGAEFSGDIAITRIVVPFPVHLKNCRFAERFVVDHARFERSLIIESSVFEKGFEILRTNLAEDLILDADPSTAHAQSQTINEVSDVHADGLTEITTAKDISVNFLKTDDLHLVTVGDVSTLGLNLLDVNSLRVDSSTQGSKIASLTVSSGHIHNSMRVSAVDIDLFSAQQSEIQRLVLSGTRVDKGIDLSFANISWLSWAMGNDGGFPPKTGNNLTGMTFKNIEVTRNSDPSKEKQDVVPQDQPQGAKLERTTQNPEAEKSEIATTSLEMLNHSQYSASAYDALEKLFASRGDPMADEVFVDGRKAKRWNEVSWKRPLSYFTLCVDLFQEYVLGYGRMARWPMIWSVITILVGCFLFRYNVKSPRMERTPETADDASPFSALWYSFELFVPVIDIGVARKWRPATTNTALTNYAHLHQILGWILVPVIAVALTGLAR